MAKPVFFIDGIDGSGKSSFCVKMAETLRLAGVEPTVLHVDDFRRVVDWRGESEQASQYYDDYYDLDALSACVQAFARGEPTLAFARWQESEILQPAEVAARDALIVEGTFTRRIAYPEAIHVYLTVSYEQARARIMERDTGRGRSVSEVTRRINNRYFLGQKRYHAEYQPHKTAHLVLDNQVPIVPKILRDNTAALPSSLRDALRRALSRHLADKLR